MGKLADRGCKQYVSRKSSKTATFNCSDKKTVFADGAKQVIEGHLHAKHDRTVKAEAQNHNLEPERNRKGVTMQSKQYKGSMNSSISYRRKLRSHTGESVEEKCHSIMNTKKRAKTIGTGFTNNKKNYHEGQGQHITDMERCDLPSSSVLPADESSESENRNSMIVDETSGSEQGCDELQNNIQNESIINDESEVTGRTLGSERWCVDVQKTNQDESIKNGEHEGTQGTSGSEARCDELQKNYQDVSIKNCESEVTKRTPGSERRCVDVQNSNQDESIKNFINEITQRDHSVVENDEEGNFSQLTNQRDIETSKEKNNPGGDSVDSDFENKVNSPYELRKKTLTLTYRYTRIRKSSKTYTCTYNGCEKIPPFKDFTELIVHTELEHSDDEDDIGNKPVCKYNKEIEYTGDQDDVNSRNEYACKHKNCAILAPFKDFSDLIAHTETVHSDTEDEDRESEGQVGTNQETVSSVEERIFQDAWENFKRNSTTEAASQRYMEANNGHTCPVCNRVFEKENERNLHVKLHTQMVHMCVHRPCGWTFERFHELQWHYSTHHSSAKERKNQELKSKIRPSFSPGLEITGHDSPRFDENTEVSQQHSEIPSFNSNGTRRESADVPVVARTQNTKFVCSLCKRVFKNNRGYSSHVRNHGSMKYKCMESTCGWEFIDFTQMKNHYFQIHKLDISLHARYNYNILSDAEKRCPICSRQLPTTCRQRMVTYDYHMQNHDKMMFKCLHQFCGWMFEKFLHVRVHYNVYHKKEAMDNEEGKYRVKPGGSLKQSENSNTEERESRSDSHETGCEAVVDVIRCEEESDEVEFLSEIIDCTGPGDSSGTSSRRAVHNCESDKIETIAKSFYQRETNHHQVPMHANKTNVNITSKSSKKSNRIHINRHSGLKYRCLHKKCVSMFKTFQQLKIHYQKAHSEIIQQLHRRNYLCRIKGHLSLEPQKRHSNYKESTVTRKRRTDENLRFSPRKKRRISDRSLSESITRQKESRNVRAKSLSVVKHKRGIAGLNLKNNAGYHRRMKCPRCTRELPRHVFKDHVKNHATLKFRCSYDRCKWMFANYSQLKMHYRNKHHCNVPKKAQNGARGRFQSPLCTVMQCPECQRHLHKNQYDNHLLNHYQMTYRCSRANCGWLFESESQLNVHYENHPDMRYKCVYAKCGWVFEKSHQLCGHYYCKHKPMSEAVASQHRIHSEYLVNSAREQRTFPADNKSSHTRSHSEKSCSTQPKSLRDRKRNRVNSLETKSTQTPKKVTKDSSSLCSAVSDLEGNDSKIPNISKSAVNVESSVRNMGTATLNRPLVEQNTSSARSRLTTNQLNRRETSKDLISTDERNSKSQLAIMESNATGMNFLGTVTYLRLDDLSDCTVGSETNAVKMELKEESPIAKENNEFFQMS